MRSFYCFLIIAVLLVLSAGQDAPAKEEKEVASDDCTCVPYYQCANGSVIEDGASLIDVRIKNVNCDSYLDVCCKTPQVVDPNAGAEEEGGDGEVLEWPKCGVRHPEGVAFRITGATDGEAQFGEFPWMVAILLSTEMAEHEVVEGSGDSPQVKHVLLYQCGGALIHPFVVVTGAHCVESYIEDSIIVRVGEWDSQTNKEIYGHQDRIVSSISIHPYFKNSTLFNDVALLILSEAIKPAKHIGFVCLPPQNLEPQPETRCLASGWGKNAFDEGKYSTILKRVEVPVVGHASCQKKLRMTRLGHYFKLHQSFMCAGGEKGIDTCKGDGGSPLVCPHPKEPGRYMQSGIVAWGIGCQEQEIPGVYANLAKFREWIDEKMLEHGFNTDYYSL